MASKEQCLADQSSEFKNPLDPSHDSLSDSEPVIPSEDCQGKSPELIFSSSYASEFVPQENVSSSSIDSQICENENLIEKCESDFDGSECSVKDEQILSECTSLPSRSDTIVNTVTEEDLSFISNSVSTPPSSVGDICTEESKISFKNDCINPTHDNLSMCRLSIDHSVTGSKVDISSLEIRDEELPVISDIPIQDGGLQAKNLNVISADDNFVSSSSSELNETVDNLNSLIHLSSLSHELENVSIHQDIESTDEEILFVPDENLCLDTLEYKNEIPKAESNEHLISENKAVIDENCTRVLQRSVETLNENKLRLVIDVPKFTSTHSEESFMEENNPSPDHDNHLLKSTDSGIDNSCQIDTKVEFISQGIPLENKAPPSKDLHSSISSSIDSGVLSLDEESSSSAIEQESENEPSQKEQQGEKKVTGFEPISHSSHHSDESGSTCPNSRTIINDLILNLEGDSCNSISGNVIDLTNLMQEAYPNYLPSIINRDNANCNAELSNTLHSSVLEAKLDEKCSFKKDEVSKTSENCSLPTLKTEVRKESECRRTSLLSQVTLPTISEKVSVEDDLVESEILVLPEFNLQNSPMLRRSRGCKDGKVRRDCRLLFSEDIPHESDEIPSEKKPFQSLRDSLDISKHEFNVEAEGADEQEKSESEHLTQTDPLTASELGSNIEIVSEKSSKEGSGQKSFPPCAGKSISLKKKSSKAEKESVRRVSFPEDDSRLITSYLEPVNPWDHMNNVSTDDIYEAYKKSCERHNTRTLPIILQQITALPVGVGGRIECLSIKNHKLEAKQCECLEEIFRRVQFQTLDFEGCELDDDTAIPLFDMIEFYDSAIYLNISSNNKIGTRGWQACSKMLKRTHSLKMLEARSTNLTEQNMPPFCKALRLGTRLTTLHLENCNLTGRPLINLVGALRLNDTIMDLFLADNRLGANDCIQLGNLIRSNKTLKLLDLRNNNIQDAGCARICTEIAEQQELQRRKIQENDSTSKKVGLTTLVLWNNYITVHVAPFISSMLFENSSLETLNLGRNNLTTEGILLLQDSLIRNKSLKRLGLQATYIHNEAAVALAECIAENKVIERLDLRENFIRVAGLLALCRSLKINNTVVQLDIDLNPKAESTPDLLDQHLMLHQEIKALCQQNQTKAHLRDASNKETECNRSDKINANIDIEEDKRKISLTCETTNRHSDKDKSPEFSLMSESKRYWSPAPSPSVSPCPSPSLSPSPSPMPSPMKNRFKVFKVSEESRTPSPSINLPTVNSVSPLSTSAPGFLMNSSMSGSLPSLSPSVRQGRRFTVTRVRESSALAKSSLPNSRAVSTPSLIASTEYDNGTPTIVVSSPNKAVRGFSVDDMHTEVAFRSTHDCFDKERSNSLDLPSLMTRGTTDSSPGSDSPQDEVFLQDSSSLGKSGFSPPFEPSRKQGVTQRAPLASVEAGSFDSDSEDSEVTTQSSDSTHSDEVLISAEQTTPTPAWGVDANKVKSVATSDITQGLMPIKEK